MVVTRSSRKTARLDYDIRDFDVINGRMCITAYPSPGVELAKRQKKAKLSRRNKKGALANLMSVPVDVFAEVMCYLLPLDLLRLARSSRNIRSILMSKSARFIWVRSFGSLPTWGAVPFPACPPDLSEPEYASLIFDKWCLGCQSLRSSRVYFENRLRACKRCADSSEAFSTLQAFLTVCGIGNEITVTQEIRDIYHLVPVLDGGLGSFFPPVALAIYRKCMVRKARISPPAYSEFLNAWAEMKPLIQENALQLQEWDQRYTEDREMKEVVRHREKMEEIARFWKWGC